MKISELAKQTNVSKQTIHYYIREGLLHKPRKTGVNKAQYTAEHVAKIKLIKSLQENQHLPLSTIKKILRINRKSSAEKKETLKVIIEHFRPIDRLLGEQGITGVNQFLDETGLNRKWYLKFKEWGIISPKKKSGKTVFSSLDITLGKLIVAMDNIGFGPDKDGRPDHMKALTNSMEEILVSYIHEWLGKNIKESSLEETLDKGFQIAELMGLFLYYIYHRIVLDQYEAFVMSQNGK